MRLLGSVLVAAFGLATLSSSFTMAASCKSLTIEDSKLPTYPLPALAANIQGTVKLRAIVSPSGSIVDVTVIDGPEQLWPAAQDYVRSWALLAGPKDGNCIQETKVEFRVTGPVEYPSSFARFTRDGVGHAKLEHHPLKSVGYPDPLVPQMRN
jgi:TonB family protein